jgi:peptide-methionine (S)-S-oxide reductase
MKKAILAGGCFWCIEAVFQMLEGVHDIIPGYTGGTIKNPAYREVCTGRTGHAEAVEITYEEKIISFITLLEVFFVVHDPTTLNRQGNDVGTQYRSAIFYTDDHQKKAAEEFIDSLSKNNVFDSPIVTEIVPFDVFYKAETEHHNYYNQNKQQTYCDFTITPKIEKIKKYYFDKLKE